jgi:RNA polymerase sigma-70 factor (ECF subfamily)
MRAFFDTWYPRLVRYLCARVGDVDQAEDLAQEAFVRMLQHRPKEPRAWLFAVAENLARDEARLARGRVRRLQLLQVERETEVDPVGEASSAERDDADGVRRALDLLPERDRRILLLHHAGFRYREISREVGVAVGSVGPLLTRAQRRFLSAYGELHEPEDRRESRTGS